MDPHSWFSNEYTFGPVCELPVASDASDAQGKDRSRAVTNVDSIQVESCRYNDGGKVELIVTFDGRFAMASGSRSTEQCLMTPSCGSDAHNIPLDAAKGIDTQASPEYSTVDAVACRYDGRYTIPTRFWWDVMHIMYAVGGSPQIGWHSHHSRLAMCNGNDATTM